MKVCNENKAQQEGHEGIFEQRVRFLVHRSHVIFVLLLFSCHNDTRTLFTRERPHSNSARVLSFGQFADWKSSLFFSSPSNFNPTTLSHNLSSIFFPRMIILFSSMYFYFISFFYFFLPLFVTKIIPSSDAVERDTNDFLSITIIVFKWSTFFKRRK